MGGWRTCGLPIDHSPHVHHPPISETLNASVTLSPMDFTQNVSLNLTLYVLTYMNHNISGSHMAPMAPRGLMLGPRPSQIDTLAPVTLTVPRKSAPPNKFLPCLPKVRPC
jgi:hypothetical protein